MYQNSNRGSRALEPTRGKGMAKNKMAVDFTWGYRLFFLYSIVLFSVTASAEDDDYH